MREEKFERELAEITSAEIIIEDHGIPALDVQFEYEGGSCQGIGIYQLDAAFVFRFMLAVGVERLSDAVGKSVWVTHSWESVSKIEPRHAKRGTPFVIAEWQDWIKQVGPRVSARDMRELRIPKEPTPK